MAYVNKTPAKGSKALFPKVGAGGKAVSVSPGKGGVNIGTPTHCESKRAASNVKTAYKSTY